jgi:hypothetical protein
MRSGRFFWGLLILVIGVILLLGALGVLPQGRNVWQFIWPTIIILFGIWFLAAPSMYRGWRMDTENLSIPLENTKKARIRMKHGAGKLQVKSSNESGVLLKGAFTGGVEYTRREETEYTRIKLTSPSSLRVFPGFLQFGGVDWQVQLDPDIPIRLDINTGASDTKLDLHDLKLYELNLDTGASTTNITLPAQAGHTAVRVNSGAASMSIRVPEGVGARIQLERGLSSARIDTRRFPGHGNVYVSPGFDQAIHRADIYIKTGVGSIEIR